MKQLFAIPVILLGIGLPMMAQNGNNVAPGTQIQVRNNTPVDMAKWDRGRIFPGYVSADVFDAGGNPVIPKGAACEMVVRRTGPGQLTLDLQSITANNGQRYVLDATGPQFTMSRELYDNGSGLVSSVVSVISGVPGENTQYEGDHINVPSGSRLTFQLQQPLHIFNGQSSGYYNNGTY